jgi:hypothetical protein
MTGIPDQVEDRRTATIDTSILGLHNSLQPGLTLDIPRLYVMSQRIALFGRAAEAYESSAHRKVSHLSWKIRQIRTALPG